ncbi:MAG: PorV/PorQ family protein [Candidatus Marinimicrobia bacterium]|jgi:hypothetical protein|nr:PorV/PorQ family protein [Candidatus Neomarinimicrobiota bacterium]MBT3936907.1 PorV/PorQ family protein [Candidatus Neomarinimicrobiota bacterium]MBT3962168.1 PorV/PorQ family protein [Candidatus Neomarinimicrobiota bacterium]MBT4635532.1 PorV/PorQ family protein [Candidatus Neomarinimicrobiota bacterium]MBT4685060.1 PorV/PorQ family protein [Candidatus Neomarinimicrobiota bacterium]
MKKSIKTVIIIFIINFALVLQGQTINRYGTTTANFLEIGVGSSAGAMGEAYVAMANDVSSIYWNPAGLAGLKSSSALFVIQPWFVDINMLFTGGAFAMPGIGVIGFGITNLDYGEMDVTTLEYQDGTGEQFRATDMAATLTFSRNIVSWFSFGSSMKYIKSNIWHSSASAFAVDLGVLVNTKFFSFTGRDEDGMNIGMSISNYGTRMKYDGIDVYQPIDISEFEEGNYGDVAGQFRTSEWELPLIFRIGVTLKPISTKFTTLTLAADALHPNNNAESVNIGAELNNKIPGFGEISLRGGMKSGMDDLFVDDTKFGVTAGAGVKIHLFGNRTITVDYAYRTMGVLGGVQAYTVGFTF